MIKKAVTGLLVFTMVMPLSVAADSISSDQVAEWLKRLSHASKTLNYEGVFVYRHDNLLESVRIIHKADEKGEHERIISLNGVAREVIRNNNKVTCILPDSKDVIVNSKPEASRLPVFPSDIDTLAKYYDFVFEGHGRVAGRPVRQIAIRPKDNLRYGYRLWMDDAYELLLRSDLLDNEGNAVEQVMFTDIKLLEEIDDKRLLPNISGKEYNWVEGDKHEGKHRAAIEAVQWSVGDMPGGFYLKHKNVHTMPDNPRAVNHLLYTDGLASVSIYIESNDSSVDGLKGASRMGAVNAYGNVVGDYHVTAVGEVPGATVKLFSSSIIMNKGKH